MKDLEVRAAELFPDNELLQKKWVTAKRKAPPFVKVAISRNWSGRTTFARSIKEMPAFFIK
jgi:hypothetical protein